MELIDWRELYAANRAAIARSRSLASPLAGASAAPPRVTRPRPPKEARRPWRQPSRPPSPEPAPGGSGRWDSLPCAGGRSIWVYTPEAAPRSGAALLVVLHGCTQTAADLARGTRLNELADQRGFLVAYPEQRRRHNPQRCWNWFLPGHQARERGEPAVLADATEAVMRRARVDPSRVYLAGMSAGAAMAAVMGATYADLFAAIALHSGLPYAAATSVRAAFELMARGGADIEQCGRAAFEAMGEHARVLPTIVVHGGADGVVSPSNGDALVEQWLVTNRLAAGEGFGGARCAPSATHDGRADGGLAYSLQQWSDARGRLVQAYLKVAGLGHAWSGGSRVGSYVDDRGPDASGAICDFFASLEQR
jgi:poly(hydroxyalkanoate) depolymerase family esterase